MAQNPISPTTNNRLGPVLMLCGGICIGFAPIGLRLGIGELGPQAIAFWRYGFAVPFLFAIVLLTTRRLPVKPNRFVILGGMFFAVDVALWHIALSITTVANSTFIVNMGNLGLGFIAWLFLKERPKNLWFLAVVIALAGAAGLTFGGGVEGKSVLRGDLLAVGAAIMVSFYMLCSKIARRQMDAVNAIFWLTMTELAFGALFVLLSGEPFLPETPGGLLAPLFLALIVQVGGQSLIIAGLGMTSSSIAGLMVVIQPVVAAAVAWKLFNEPLTAIQILGGALILFAIWLSQRGRAPRRAS